ncbi:Rhabdoid tumor deletion region protein 1 [Intoshia linei]|uniref:Rhabdoid tumor deletion region protein 1 n=1 Tax=Intoshia linei TaxID=1819745 RepID=A0A177AU63_9BILA|nr:Rhabdoid tumor deletion region protein 1 [Intoshia linei]
MKRRSLLPTTIDPNLAHLAYGQYAIIKLNRGLQSSDLIERIKSVNSLSEYLHDPEHITLAITEQVPITLQNCLLDKDKIIRIKACECLKIISSHPIGRKSFEKFDIMRSILKAFDDEEENVRLHAHASIELISQSPLIQKLIMNDSLIPILVNKLKQETLQDIISIILQSLNKCYKYDPDQGLDAGALDIIIELIQSKNDDIAAKSLENLTALCITLRGKNSSTDPEIIKILVGLLKHGFVDVRCYAASSLMMIAMTTPGKYAIIAQKGIENLLILLKDDLDEIKTYALKGLTCLCEAPKARKTLISHLEKFQALKESSNETVAKAANIAIKTIIWKP